jgi:hypothetical protein
LCKELKSPSREQEDTLKLRRNEVTGEVEIKCVFERMDEYLKVCKIRDYREKNEGMSKAFSLNGG